MNEGVIDSELFAASSSVDLGVGGGGSVGGSVEGTDKEWIKKRKSLTVSICC